MFEADDASFESEVWGDVDLMMPAFQRDGYQSVTVKLIDPSTFESLQAAIAADPRLQLSARRENDYYAEQSATMTTVIRVFGTFVTLILSIGAMFGAMNTMYAAVAYRTREIGTLRALGFSRLPNRRRVSRRIGGAGAGRRCDRLRARAAGARAVDRARPTWRASVKSRSSSALRRRSWPAVSCLPR